MKNLKRILTVALIIAFAVVALIPVSGVFATSKKQLVVWSHFTQDEVKALQPIADKW
jgi:arabinogalactan oligomer/maltooligosaccharide transport system substrate-binding protein